METKRIVIDNALWNWSGYEGKLKGCIHWTKAAWADRENPRELRHEHIVPRKILIEKLLNLEGIKKETVFSILKTFCIGVVVTKSEDLRLNVCKLKSSMPPDWDGEDPWARYKCAGIYDEVIQPKQI